MPWSLFAQRSLKRAARARPLPKCSSRLQSSLCLLRLFVYSRQPRMHHSTSSKPPIGGGLTLFKLLVASLLREVRAAPALASRSSGWTPGVGVGAAGAGAILWKRADEELSSQGKLQNQREGTLRPTAVRSGSEGLCESCRRPEMGYCKAGER
jgi:hypothetical protein